jgi:ATP-dependent helicase HrpA
MWAATRRLLRLRTSVAQKSLQHALPRTATLALARSRRWSVAALLDRCVEAALDELLGEHGGPVWDEAAFEELSAYVGARLPKVAAGVAVDAAEIVGLAESLSALLGATTAPALQPAVADIERQLEGLVPPDFPLSPGAARLSDIDRYLRAAAHRLDKLPEHPRRDATAMAKIDALEQELDAVLRGLSSPTRRAEARRLRWMLEELRVSLFAQSIGPAYRVSEARVRRALAEFR